MKKLSLSNLILRGLLSLGLLATSFAQLGCASGGYKLTRKYSGFVNRQHIILRIVLYLLTGIVYAVTLLIDAVVFNTIDFWKGRVSANTYQFEEGNEQFVVKHFYEGEKKLRNSEIKVFSKKNLSTPVQVILISEKSADEINVYVDGKLRTQVSDIQDVPQITQFENGRSYKIAKDF
jgi:nitrogen fixation protein FixH